MTESMFFGIAVFVFALLVLGLVLTIIEFRHGEPRQQQKEAKRKRNADRQSGDRRS
jgi:hypothetical protein